MYCDEIVISDAVIRTVNLEMALLSLFARKNNWYFCISYQQPDSPSPLQVHNEAAVRSEHIQQQSRTRHVQSGTRGRSPEARPTPETLSLLRCTGNVVVASSSGELKGNVEIFSYF